MAEEQNSKSKTPLYCGIASVLSVIVLFIFTELIFDSSIMLQRWLMILLLAAFVPFCVMKMSDAKKADMISIGSTVFTLLVCLLLFYRRNKVNKVFVKEASEEITKKLTGMLTPSGVLIISGAKDIDFPEESVNDAELDEETGKAILKRIEKKSDSKKTPEATGDAKVRILRISADELKKTRFSGIKNQLIIEVEGDENAAKSRGFTIL